VLLKLPGDPLLAAGARRPRLLMPGRAELGQAGAHAAEPDGVPARATALLTRAAPTVELAVRTRPRLAAIEICGGALLIVAHEELNGAWGLGIDRRRQSARGNP
jgi:hypothetical protein